MIILTGSTVRCGSCTSSQVSARYSYPHARALIPWITSYSNLSLGPPTFLLPSGLVAQTLTVILLSMRIRNTSSRAFFLFGLWGYWHCGHSWPMVPASGNSDEKQMECTLAWETEVLGENLPQHHFCPSQSPTWPDSGRRGGKPATNRLSYGAASSRAYCRFLYIYILSNIWRADTSPSEKFTALDTFAYSLRHAESTSVRNYQTYFIVFT
jgi:hypothetical protein